jgi:hypothetical protein
MHFLTIGLGIGSALIAALAASRIAVAASRRPAAAFGLSALFLTGLLYVAVLQSLVLYVHPKDLLPASLAPETVFLLYAATTALISIASGTALVAAWIAIIRRGEQPSRFKTIGFAVLFSLALCILSAPFLIENQLVISRAITANEAEINAFARSYKAGLEKLVKVGALSRIEVEDDAITHYIGGPLYKVGTQGLAEYARAAMVYHTLVLGKSPRPVVLRDAITEDRIGTYRPDGVFVLQTARDLSQAKAYR